MNVMTFGTSREGAYSKLLKVLRVETVLISVFLEAAEYAKQSINVSLKRIKKTGKRTCCPRILPGYNDQPSNRHKILTRDDWFDQIITAHPKISIHILHTVLYIFLMVLTRRICLIIESSSR